MRLEHTSEEKLRKDILKIISKYLDLNKYKVFFFGSRVRKNKGSERSDIDLGIEGDQLIPARIMLAIKEDIKNLKTLYHIDIVDFASVDDDFKKVAKESIEIISK